MAGTPTDPRAHPGTGEETCLVAKRWLVLIQLGALGGLTWWITGVLPPWDWAQAYLRKSAPWIVLLTYALVFWPGGTLVAVLTKKWAAEVEKEEPAKGLLNGGLWIGRLERLLTVSFVLAGRSEAIGALVVAKGFIRFAEIKNSGHRKIAEYIFIGSMTSFGLALVVGWIARRMLAVVR